MNTDKLNSMSIDKLWSLHDQVRSVLSSKLSDEKDRLEKSLSQLRAKAPGRDRRPYPSSASKVSQPGTPLGDLGWSWKAASLGFGAASVRQEAGRS